MTVSIVQLQADLGTFGTTLASLGHALDGSDFGSQIDAGIDFAGAFLTVTNDLISLASTNSIAEGISKVTPLAGIAITLSDTLRDLKTAQQQELSPSGATTSIKIAVASDLAALTAQALLLSAESAGISELAPEVPAVLGTATFVAGLGSAVSSFMSSDGGSDTVAPIIVNGVTTTFDNGEKGAWHNNGDGTATFVTWDSSTLQTINSVTVPVGDEEAPNGAGFTFTTQGTTINVDSSGSITGSNSQGILTPGYGGSIVINPYGSTSTNINGNGISDIYSGDQSSTIQSNSSLQSSGQYYDTLHVDSDNGQQTTQTFNLNDNQLSTTTVETGSGNFQSTSPASGITVDSAGSLGYQYGISGSNGTYNANALGAATLVDTGTGNTLNTGGESGATLIGANNDTLVGNSDSSTLIASGTGIIIQSSYENIVAPLDASLNVYGSGDNQIQGGPGAYVGLVGGMYNNVVMSDGTLASALEANANLDGSGNQVNYSDDGYLGLTGGIDNGVTTSGSQIDTLANVSFNLSGGTNSGDNLSLGNGGVNVGLIGGSGYNVYAATDTVALTANTAADIGGNSATIALDGGSATVDASGTSDTIFVNPDYTNEVITGSNEQFVLGNNVDVTIDGSHDNFQGGSNDTFHIEGSDDDVYASDSTIDFSDGSGDEDNGAGDGGYGGYSGGGYGTYSGFGGYGGYAFASKAAATGTDIGKIASYDASLTDQADAVTAETAKLEAANAATALPAPVPEFEGPKWASNTITWSLATSQGSLGTPFSGFIGSQYEATVEQAFATWAAASGLKFQEVADSSQSDIRIGWSTFNAASSGVLGYTDLQSLNGNALAGTTVSLEDPAEDSLITDANGQLAYSGSDIGLSQLLLHEIGHALGLADNADPNSVLSAVLSTSNQKLDATDVAGIEALYPAGGLADSLTNAIGGSSTSPPTVTSSLSTYSAQAAQLIDAMAAFSPTSSSSLTTLPPSLGSILNSAMSLAAAH